jgi:hypothetical protein
MTKMFTALSKSPMKKIFTLLFLIISVYADAQEDSVVSGREFLLNVNSNNTEAKVFVDSILIGNIPVSNYMLKEGIYEIKIIIIPAEARWNNENILFKDFHIKSDTVITADFSYFYFIRSNPYNASVYKNDSLLGHTPLRYFNKNELTGILTLKKKGFRDYLYNLSSYNFETGADITLIPQGKETIEDIVHKNRDTRFKTKRSFLPAISFGVAALASGYGAIHFKNKANDHYDRYLMDPVINREDLDNSNRNDVYSMITLGLMQAALAGVIYFLFLD